jgi:hypothetical protein
LTSDFLPIDPPDLHFAIARVARPATELFLGVNDWKTLDNTGWLQP